MAVVWFSLSAIRFLMDAKMKWVAIAGAVFAIAMLVQAIRRWRYDYVRLGSDGITILSRGRVYDHIGFASVACAKTTFYKTVLQLKDGSETSIFHTNFASRNDVRDFVSRLGDSLAANADTHSRGMAVAAPALT